LGGITFAYSQLAARRAADVANSERLERINSEVELRFHDVLRRIERIRAARKKPGRNADDEKAQQNGVDLTTFEFLIPEETRVLFAKPDENEQYQMEFAKYTVKSLFAEAYFLSRNLTEKLAIYAALRYLERARIFQRNRTLLESGKIPPNFHIWRKSTDFQESERAKYEATAIKGALEYLTKNQDSFEENILKAWDFWQRRKTLKKEDLPSELPETLYIFGEEPLS